MLHCGGLTEQTYENVTRQQQTRFWFTMRSKRSCETQVASSTHRKCECCPSGLVAYGFVTLVLGTSTIRNLNPCWYSGDDAIFWTWT